MRLAILVTAALTGCQFAPTEADKQQLRDWWSLYRTQSAACDGGYSAMAEAFEMEMAAEARALAVSTAAKCDEGAGMLASFGELPGTGSAEGNSSKDHECSLALAERANAARKAKLLIEGDTRASLRLEIVELTKNAGGHSGRCRADTAARAESLDIPESELEGLEQLTLPVDGSGSAARPLPDL